MSTPPQDPPSQPPYPGPSQPPHPPPYRVGPAPLGPAPAPPKTKWYRTKWALWAGIFLLGGGFGNAMAGGNSTSTPAPAPTVTVTAPAPVTTVPEAPVSTESPTVAPTTPAPAPTVAPATKAPTKAAAPAPAPVKVSLAKRMTATLADENFGGADLKPSWVWPITKIEDLVPGKTGDSVYVYYQETLNKTTAQDVGHVIATWTTLSDPSIKADLKVIVLHDAQGLDHNYYVN